MNFFDKTLGSERQFVVRLFSFVTSEEYYLVYNY